MPQIHIPALRWKQNVRAWKLGAVRTDSGKFFVWTSSYDIQAGRILYYPYWVGKVLTVKSRLLFGDKKLFFYVTCNGLNGTYLVMRDVPQLTECEVSPGDILPHQIPRARFEGAIMDEGINLHIVRQFIFGAPYCEKLGSRLLYIPMQEFLIKSKINREFRPYLINVFTGRVEARPQPADKPTAPEDDELTMPSGDAMTRRMPKRTRRRP